MPTTENFLSSLPDDKETLKAMLRSLWQERERQEKLSLLKFRTVAPENSEQTTAKSYRQANRRPNELGALPELVNEIPKFTDVCTETARAQISKAQGDAARTANLPSDSL